MIILTYSDFTFNLLCQKSAYTFQASRSCAHCEGLSGKSERRYFKTYFVKLISNLWTLWKICESVKGKVCRSHIKVNRLLLHVLQCEVNVIKSEYRKREDLPQRHRDHGEGCFPRAGRRRPGKRASAWGESSLVRSNR